MKIISEINNKNNRSRFLNIVVLTLIFLIGLFLLTFVAYKASTTSFVHDESYTYNHYVHQKFMDILSFKDSNINNHILNSLLVKYSEIAFGTSELTLRFPNILALIIYMIFTVLLLRKDNRELLLPLFILMTFNPYLLDFFGLARGYGLSISMMIMSIYFLINYFKGGNETRDLAYFNLGALLATLSNFTLLNYYVAALVTFNIILFLNYLTKNELQKYKSNFFNLNKVNIISVFISIVILFEPIRRLTKTSGLDSGANNLLHTISSQVYNTFYSTKISDNLNYTLVYLIIVIILVNFIIIGANVIFSRKKFLEEFHGIIVVNFIFIIIILETITQHILLNNDYYKDRFALFLYPLVILNFAYLMHYLMKTRLKHVVLFCCFLLIPLFVKNLYSNLYFQLYKDWQYDMSTKEMLFELENYENKTNQGKKQIQLGINWVFEPTINFYIATKNLQWIKPVTREGLKDNDDFYYVFDDELKTTDKVIFNSNAIKTTLYEKKRTN